MFMSGDGASRAGQGAIFLVFAALYVLGLQLADYIDGTKVNAERSAPDGMQLVVAVIVGMLGVCLYNVPSGSTDEQTNPDERKPNGTQGDEGGVEAQLKGWATLAPEEREAIDLVRVGHRDNPRDFTNLELIAYTGGTGRIPACGVLSTA